LVWQCVNAAARKILFFLEDGFLLES
jgi:hypothetical protein